MGDHAEDEVNRAQGFTHDNHNRDQARARRGRNKKKKAKQDKRLSQAVDGLMDEVAIKQGETIES